jgi:hypothetical protein
MCPHWLELLAMDPAHSGAAPANRDGMIVMKYVRSAVITALARCLSTAAARAEIKTQWVDYIDGSTALQGYLAFDDGVTGKRPGVLLLHRRDGMSDLTLENARMYAAGRFFKQVFGL